MTARTKTIALGLTGAVAAASAAYAVGSQVGGGSAAAQSAAAPTTTTPTSTTTPKRDHDHGRFGPGGLGLDGLADRLGVDPAKLRAVFEDLRPARPPKDRRDDLVQGLASALGLPEDKVRSALEKLRPAGRRDRDRGPGHALGPGHRHRPGFGPDAAALAKALGVDTAKLRAALEKLRDEHGQDERARRDAFAAALATKLGISEQRVKDALPEWPGPGGGHPGP